MALEGLHDILIVDRMLPKMDGLSIIRALRAKGITTPGSDSERPERRGRARQGPARRRRRLPGKALCLLRASGPR